MAAPALAAPLAAGFADPVHDAQCSFAAVMRAMAEPGLAVPLASDLDPPAPLSREAAACALALLDYETPVFLDAALSAAPAVAAFLRFHTGAPVVDDPAAARFALIADGAALPDFGAFAQGEPDYPDRSATLIVQVQELGAGALVLAGPGIKGRRSVSAAPLPADLPARLAANRALYPLGIDLILTAQGPDGLGAVMGLPRSVKPVMED
ncbi:phosphonate C-P lyase system protein PhnH [Xanthobacter autotrophicus]|uniref:phosphonate C-P lyase system protein PhnH n=1 Tax=Xanthobacter autotrophicus TaxID=280 RepID=UPI001E3E7436|nr:phosphonate C-P lyase system protein PhnH [Xanthobacter autotrophicus]UDQ90336.1 phosphonate C-P lyase system protein PhnH [Xanthobacter autotrophicus]